MNEGTARSLYPAVIETLIRSDRPELSEENSTRLSLELGYTVTSNKRQDVS